MADDKKTEKEKVDGFNKWKNEALESRTIIAELTQKTQELWEKAANLDLQVLGKQKENEALKAKLEALNDTARQNLAKKNFADESLQKMEAENAKLLRQNGVLISENKQIEKLNEIKTNLESEVLGLKKANEKLNDSLLTSEQNLKELNLQKGSLNLQVENLKAVNATLKKDLDLSSIAKLNLNTEIETLKSDAEILKAAAADLQSEIGNLTWENAAFKKQIGAKNGKMNSFKTVVIFLAVLANFLLLGKKFMGLTGEKDWQTYLISYGSVLIFDLTVIFLTMVNRSKEALYFGIGVFILTFFQIGKPFEAIKQYFGTDLHYLEVVISGCIYSFFFAFLSYFLSKIKTN